MTDSRSEHDGFQRLTVPGKPTLPYPAPLPNQRPILENAWRHKYLVKPVQIFGGVVAFQMDVGDVFASTISYQFTQPFLS